MAKGFTVKAAAPKKKAEDWDIAAIKERMRGKQIVFCLPGRGYSFLTQTSTDGKFVIKQAIHNCFRYVYLPCPR